MQTINVKLISMNCENICVYLCFCCADAVDCGAASPRFMDWVSIGWFGTSLPPLWIADQVRNDGTVLVVLACCCPALWIDESPITLCQRARL